MKTLFTVIGMFAGSALGWMLGTWLSSSMPVCFFVSALGSFAGIYAGWWLTRRLDLV